MALMSMTGFGKASTQNQLGTFVVEVRSVNNRYFDFAPHLAREWAAVEVRLRDLVHRRISRGKVDFWLQWTAPPNLSVEVELNEEIIGEVAQRFRQAGERVGMEIGVPWAEMFRLPGFLTIRPAQLDADALYATIERVAIEALDQLDAMRAGEGQSLAEALKNHLTRLRRLTDDVERLRGCVLEKQRERLQRLVEQWRPELSEAVSADRLESEILLLADKADITEEIVRLRSHFDALERLLSSDSREPVGKHAEFIAQEILREANTIGSKARDTEISAATVSIKHETEKIREQIQNVE